GWGLVVTLGTGIFLSSVFLGLVLLYWITKDRWRWSRILLWLVGSVGAIGAGVYLYFTYQPPPTKLLEYADLKLGMRQSEVNYVKGQPANVYKDDPSQPGWAEIIEVSKLEQGKSTEDFLAWSYPIGDSSRIDVNFDADKKVKTIECYSQG